jgi:excisionase family DNA binding protein
MTLPTLTAHPAAAHAHERILVGRKEAASMLGLSLDTFKRRVQGSVPCVYVGRRRLFRPSDLERWADRQAIGPVSATVTAQETPARSGVQSSRSPARGVRE